tara:strand:- start:5201 stop:5752 length:552 start_codon:yes stop_codon:yes gene_type:complete
MSSILYYSNYCDHCRNLLSILTKSNLLEKIHFLCIDKRIVKNSKTYIVTENNEEILLPNNISSVPTLLLLKDNFRSVLGTDILEHFKLSIVENNNKNTFNQEEPSAFILDSYNSSSNITSDNYSFLDQSSDDLSTKGSGGTRQMYNYADINFVEKINTPDDEYVPDKVNDTNIKEREEQRSTL